MSTVVNLNAERRKRRPRNAHDYADETLAELLDQSRQALFVDTSELEDNLLLLGDWLALIRDERDELMAGRQEITR